MYPETRTTKVPRVTFYEAGGFSKIKEVEKAATILQYAMEGRLEGRISSLLTLVSPKLMQFARMLSKRLRKGMKALVVQSLRPYLKSNSKTVSCDRNSKITPFLMNIIYISKALICIIKDSIIKNCSNGQDKEVQMKNFNLV